MRKNMRSRITISTIILFLILLVSFSGCTAENRIDPVPLGNDTVDVQYTKPDLPDQGVNKTEVSVNQSSGRTTILLDDEIEIGLISLSNIYARDNRNINGHNISERNFAVYNLSIKNNGSKAFDLRSDEFNLRSGDRIFKKGNWGIAIRSGDTYTIQQFKEGVNFDTRQMAFPDATVVWMTFGNYYGWPMASRMNYNTQVVILDEEQNIIAVIYDYAHLVS